MIDKSLWLSTLQVAPVVKLALAGGFMLGLFTVKVEGRKPSFTIEFNSRDLFKFQNRFLGTFHSFLPEDWLHFSFSSCRQRRNDALFDRNCIFDCTLDNPYFWCDAVVYHKTCTFYFQNGSSSFVIPLFFPSLSLPLDCLLKSLPFPFSVAFIFSLVGPLSVFMDAVCSLIRVGNVESFMECEGFLSQKLPFCTLFEKANG